MNKLPLDVNLLSLDKTFTILADLFELRPEIALAVAKDTPIIDERPLNPKNPVYREFALARTSRRRGHWASGNCSPTWWHG